MTAIIIFILFSFDGNYQFLFRPQLEKNNTLVTPSLTSEHGSFSAPPDREPVITIHPDSYNKEWKYKKYQGSFILKNRAIIVVQEISEQNRGCQERIYRYVRPGMDTLCQARHIGHSITHLQTTCNCSRFGLIDQKGFDALPDHKFRSLVKSLALSLRTDSPV